MFVTTNIVIVLNVFSFNKVRKYIHDHDNNYITICIDIRNYITKFFYPNEYLKEIQLL